MSSRRTWQVGPLTAYLLPRAPRSTEISGVARGLGLIHDGRDLTGEGMGIGGVVLRLGGVTYFPLTTRDSLSDDGASRTFELNGVARKMLGPLDVTGPHRFLRESLSPLYLRGGRGALAFRGLMRVRSLLIRTEYRSSERVEVCVVSYRFNGCCIEIRVSRETGRGKLIVANELSGTLFDSLVVGGSRIALGPWVRCPSRTPALLSRTLGICVRFELPEGAEAFAGREVLPPRLDWAGVDLILDEGVLAVTYAVRICSGPSTPALESCSRAT
ncbi:MAG: hypothetical protein QXP81_03600 [Nitrososphaerota archaeon]|nr:hypothetical protein [Candidatus Calditenuis fumarioli]